MVTLTINVCTMSDHCKLFIKTISHSFGKIFIRFVHKSAGAESSNVILYKVYMSIVIQNTRSRNLKLNSKLLFTNRSLVVKHFTGDYKV